MVQMNYVITNFREDRMARTNTHILITDSFFHIRIWVMTEIDGKGVFLVSLNSFKVSVWAVVSRDRRKERQRRWP